MTEPRISTFLTRPLPKYSSSLLLREASTMVLLKNYQEFWLRITRLARMLGDLYHSQQDFLIQDRPKSINFIIPLNDGLRSVILWYGLYLRINLTSLTFVEAEHFPNGFSNELSHWKGGPSLGTLVLPLLKTFHLVLAFYLSEELFRPLDVCWRIPKPQFLCCSTNFFCKLELTTSEQKSDHLHTEDRLLRLKSSNFRWVIHFALLLRLSWNFTSSSTKNPLFKKNEHRLRGRFKLNMDLYLNSLNAPAFGERKLGMLKPTGGFVWYLKQQKKKEIAQWKKRVSVQNKVAGAYNPKSHYDYSPWLNSQILLKFVIIEGQSDEHF